MKEEEEEKKVNCHLLTVLKACLIFFFLNDKNFHVLMLYELRNREKQNLKREKRVFMRHALCFGNQELSTLTINVN